MNMLIKNVDEEVRYFLKVQATKEKTTIGRLLRRMAENYKRRESQDILKAWQRIFEGSARITKEEAKSMRRAGNYFREIVL